MKGFMKNGCCAVLSAAFLILGCSSMKNINAGSFEMEEMVIESGSRSIVGNLYRPESNDEKKPLIIFSHGYNGSGKDFAEDAVFFAKNGYCCYSYDFCGGSVNSRSSGNTKDMTIYSEKQDLMDVISYFSEQEYIDADNIILFGGSQGGFVTALTAAELKDKIKAVVLLFPALCIPNNWNDRFKTDEEIPSSINFWGMELGRDFFVTARKIKPFDIINGYEGPVCIFHGTNDQIVPLSYSERAKKAYGNAKLVVMQGEGHGFTPAGSATARKSALKFLGSVQDQK